MVEYFEVHPVNPQPRTVAHVADIVAAGGLVAYPTDSGYALGCQLGNADGLARITRIRDLGPRHHFTIVVDEFAKLGAYVQMDNWAFRAIKAATPGPYTFILKATRDVPRMMQHPKKRTVGVRIPQHRTALALLGALDGPLQSSSLLLPGDELPRSDGWQVQEILSHDVDVVLDSGDCGLEPTTVVDLTGDEPEVLRLGAGDPEPFTS
ncbi:MAG: L-threonylcarbamoyladenylate synthase [Arachnia sp.]